MAEYSRLAKGSFTANGGTNAINLPFQPQYVELLNFTAYTTPTATWVAKAYWDENMGQAAALYETITATTLALVPAATTTLGISTFSAGLLFQYGAQKQIIGATAANPIVFNVTAHGYVVGDIVMFEGLYQSSTTGMSQLSGIPFVISAVGDADHFSVVWPGAGSNYTALSGSPSGAYVKKVLYPFLYAPGVSFIEAITTGTTTTVVTTAPHNFVVGQQVGFDIPSIWGTTQLNELPNTTIPGSPKYYYVISVTNSTTFVINANTTNATAFNTNQTIAQVKAGMSFPQVKAVGDVNTGGVQISSGSVLYPPPVVNSVNTINGPAIQGAFVNNTRQGFTVGATVASVASQVWYYRAYLFDYSNP
jgi:hypothetical protein